MKRFVLSSLVTLALSAILVTPARANTVYAPLVKTSPEVIADQLSTTEITEVLNYLLITADDGDYGNDYLANFPADSAIYDQLTDLGKTIAHDLALNSGDRISALRFVDYDLHSAQLTGAEVNTWLNSLRRMVNGDCLFDCGYPDQVKDATITLAILLHARQHPDQSDPLHR